MSAADELARRVAGLDQGPGDPARGRPCQPLLTPARPSLEAAGLLLQADGFLPVVRSGSGGRIFSGLDGSAECSESIAWCIGAGTYVKALRGAGSSRPTQRGPAALVAGIHIQYAVMRVSIPFVTHR